MTGEDAKGSKRHGMFGQSLCERAAKFKLSPEAALICAKKAHTIHAAHNLAEKALRDLMEHHGGDSV